MTPKIPHRRFNPLTGEWVLISPHRTQRPWQGQQENEKSQEIPSYDPNCYLCPGNIRANKETNPKYEKTFVFENDFPALYDNDETLPENPNELLLAKKEIGTCKVICYSPLHNLTMAKMTPGQIVNVIEEWIKQYKQIGSQKNINYVQIFENRGPEMGASNPHPHGQLWATSQLPTIVEKEQNSQLSYVKKNKSNLLADYLETELKTGDRVVDKNDDFVTLVPFWAVWPYETMILPRKSLMAISELNGEQIKNLAESLKIILTKYDNLFQTSFPYSMGIHQKPTDNKKHPEWTMHFHFYPPLLRSATIKKFMVGYEMLAEAQRDITPEDAAQTLLNLPNDHYSVT